LRDDGTVSSFRVIDVRHEEKESEGFLTRRYTGLTVFLNKDDRPQPSGGGKAPGRDPVAPPGAMALTVLDFSARPPNARSRLHNFSKLLAWVVAVGYRDQRLLLEGMKQLAWQLRWDGRRWLLAHVAAGHSPEELRELSRAAKRAGLDAEEYLERILGIAAQETQEVAEVISLDAYRR
jgi:hypothetical protein